MKYIQYFENFACNNDTDSLRWNVLRFLLRKEDGATLKEIFGNFPMKYPTEEALKQLLLTDYILYDDQSGLYRGSLFAKDQSMSLSETLMLPYCLVYLKSMADYR